MSTPPAAREQGSDGAPAGDFAIERRMEMLVGRLLQAGVLCSGLIVLIGGAAFLAHHGGDATDFRHFRGPTENASGLRGVLRGVSRFDSRAIVELGLLLLIATPIARVALTVVAFAVRRDRLYVILSAAVLALLVAGLVWRVA